MWRARASAFRAAASAPSGANQQPWRFVVVTDVEIKRRIRVASEEVERRFYGGAAGEAWIEAIARLGTDARKPFLEIAPCLIAALHHAGLATLPYTPQPMGFLNRILGRPANERPLLIVVAGFPAEGAKLPDIERKPFGEIATFHPLKIPRTPGTLSPR